MHDQWSELYYSELYMSNAVQKVEYLQSGQRLNEFVIHKYWLKISVSVLKPETLPQIIIYKFWLY